MKKCLRKNRRRPLIYSRYSSWPILIEVVNPRPRTDKKAFELKLNGLNC